MDESQMKQFRVLKQWHTEDEQCLILTYASSSKGTEEGALEESIILHDILGKSWILQPKNRLKQLIIGLYWVIKKFKK